MNRLCCDDCKSRESPAVLKRQATFCLVFKKTAYGYAGDCIPARGGSALLLICAVPVEQ
jgi:hypothetical protein